MTTSFQSVILAAGKGTRMRSQRPKVLHEVLGVPMVDYAVRASLNAGADRAVVVVGYGAERVRTALQDRPYADSIDFAHQEKQLGTGHAVWSARDALEHGSEWTAVLSGDAPLITSQAVDSLVEGTRRANLPLGLVTAHLEDPTGYGRIVRDSDEELVRIVEETDATPTQRDIDEVNAGTYVGRTQFLLDRLGELCSGSPDNAQGEFYLTDLVEPTARQRGVYTWRCQDADIVRGVNTRSDLARANDLLRQRINEHWMDQGVTFIDPDTTWIHPSVQLDRDVVLYPNVHLEGETVVGSGTVVETGCTVRHTKLGEDVLVKAQCYLESATVDSDTNLGPFAHLRPGADIGSSCKVGNYVEVKKARLEDGVKAGHLAYIGDAHLGERTNIGAGTITCNYDGEEKNRTEIGEGAFTGSNSSLVAPLSIGDGAYIGAGSTITDDVPPEALALGRGRQRNIEGWASEDD